MLFYFLITLLFQNCLSGDPLDDITFGPNGELPPGYIHMPYPEEWKREYEDYAKDKIADYEHFMIMTGQRPPGWKYEIKYPKSPSGKSLPMSPVAVKPEVYRFLVMVYGGKIFCGGAVIGTSWVLTAAHCIHSRVLDKSGKVKVRAGFTSPAESIQERSSAKLIIHKKYDPKELFGAYDIGLIQVDSPFKITKNLGIIPIAGPGIAKECKFMSVCGIGYDLQLSKNGATMSYETAIKRPLKCAYVHFDNKSKCEKTSKAPAADKPKLLFTKAWITACQADSGGPLICKNVVVGVIGKQPPCSGDPGSCQAYAKVEEFSDFLEQNIDGFLVPKGESTVKNQTKAEKKSKAEEVTHAIFWQICFIPLLIIFFIN